MKLNKNVNLDTSFAGYDRFYPDDGYALWDDTEEGNLDEVTGEPLCYFKAICMNKANTENKCEHIKARQADETTDVY